MVIMTPPVPLCHETPCGVKSHNFTTSGVAKVSVVNTLIFFYSPPSGGVVIPISNRFEFSVVFLTDWLTTKVRESSLPCYLAYNEGVGLIRFTKVFVQK